MAYLSDGTLAVLSMTSRTMQPVVRQRILEHTRRWTKMTTTTEKSSVRVKQTGPASTGRIHRGWKVVTNLRECQRRENDHTCGPFRTCGPRPLTIWTHPWIHLHPLLDHRPKQVPPQRWHSQKGAPPLSHPRGGFSVMQNQTSTSWFWSQVVWLYFSCPKRASKHFQTRRLPWQQ